MNTERARITHSAWIVGVPTIVRTASPVDAVGDMQFVVGDALEGLMWYASADQLGQLAALFLRLHCEAAVSEHAARLSGSVVEPPVRMDLEV